MSKKDYNALFLEIEKIRKMKAKNIALYLKKKGVKGEVGEADSCPLANHLQKVSHIDDISVTGEEIKIDNLGLQINTEDSEVPDFVSAFDEEEYPFLID